MRALLPAQARPPTLAASRQSRWASARLSATQAVMRLESLNAVVTGGNRGIGLEVGCRRRRLPPPPPAAAALPRRRRSPITAH